MKKDTYYFSHDYNAANDIKILFLRQQLGIEGYGIYWYLIEQLAQSGGYLPVKIAPVLAMQIQVTEVKLMAVITKFELFEIDDEMFFSARLNKHLEVRKAIKEGAAKGAAARWKGAKTLEINAGGIAGGIAYANAGGNAKERKGKERKVKEIKEKENNNAGAFDFFGFLISHGADNQLLEDWLKVRKNKRAANTESAAKIFLREIAKSGKEINEILETCINRSWQGFKAEWIEDTKQVVKVHQNASKSEIGVYQNNFTAWEIAKNNILANSAQNSENLNPDNF